MVKKSNTTTKKYKNMSYAQKKSNYSKPKATKISTPKTSKTKNLETTTRIRLVGECNYDDHFTLKWEYE